VPLPPSLSNSRTIDATFGVGLPGFPGAPISIPGLPNPISPWLDLLNSGKEVAALVTFIVDPHNWLRLAEAVAGGMLILIGIVAVLWDTRAGEEVRQGLSAAGGSAAATAAKAAIA
jgi:hypothetical protein